MESWHDGAVTRAQDNAGGDRDGAGLPRVPSIPLSDEKTVAAAEAADASIGSLVKEATTHLSTLVRAEVELARTEMAKEVKKGLTGGLFFMIALVVILYSSFFFFFFLGELLSNWLPRWAAFGIVFLLMLLFAAFCGFLGYRKVKKIQAPERTISSMKDTAAALRHPGAEHDAPVAP
ncbi:phage holin family protein [Labedaea rhizosphaerae]|uniref:phage holin family protein n=1 Tax=Labedaea rhizosphaerae TaxID=598644 RepID=UPI003C79F998